MFLVTDFTGVASAKSLIDDMSWLITDLLFILFIDSQDSATLKELQVAGDLYFDASVLFST